MVGEEVVQHVELLSNGFSMTSRPEKRCRISHTGVQLERNLHAKNRGGKMAKKAKKSAKKAKKSAKKSTRKTAGKRSTQKRERLSSKNASFYAKRSSGGRFKEMDEVGRSTRSDRPRKAKTKTKSGYGDQGDR
jgi:hypothetical protein